MHKKIFNHDSCKKNKIIVSKKNLHEKRNICDIILRNHKKKTREMSNDTSRSSMSFLFYIKLMSLYFVGSIVI